MEIRFGDTVEATCRYDYSGLAGYFTFALEIGTIIALEIGTIILGGFNTLDRWEQQVYVSPGAGKSVTITFVVTQVSGLNEGDTYDMNYEIGTGSQQDGSWELLERLFTDDIITIMEEVGEFSNLSVTYKRI